ncbi:hypothetical protein L345_02278, partial [Ophiophagus hannah]
MDENAKFKDGEKSQLASSFNAKEELLLNNQVRILNSMKKQAENSIILDQRILYNRFSMKLRKSEVAHAKLFGDRELVEQLSRSLFPNLHSVVTDDSKKAIGILLQNTEASRAISAPCRIQKQQASVSVTNSHSSYKIWQGKEAEIKEQQNSVPATVEMNAQLQCQKRVTSGAKGISEGQLVFIQPASTARCKRPHTSRHQENGRLSSVKYGFAKISPQLLHSAHQATDPSKFSSLRCPEGDFSKEKCPNAKSRSHKWRPSSRSLFLNLDHIPLEIRNRKSKNLKVHNYDFLNDKIKLFLEKVATLKQERVCHLQDYYSDRLQEQIGQKCQINWDFVWDNTQEQRKWKPIGSENNHRSITIKKLDMDFTKKDRPLDILIWEYYNKLLTEENLIERQWLNNNPNQLITKQDLDNSPPQD